MEKEARYLLVGLSVLVAAIGTVALLLWYSEGSAPSDAKDYTIYFRSHSLSGLQIGSAVTMRGIKIGSVSGVKILDEEERGARVVVKINPDVPVRESTIAVIERNVLTGLATIELDNSNEALPSKVPDTETLPVIPEGKGDYELIRQSLSEVVSSLNVTLNNLGEFLTPQNKQAFSILLKNLSTATEQFASQQNSLTELLGSVRAASDEIQTLAKSLNESSKTISATAERSLEVLTRDISATAKSLNESSKTVSATAERSLEVLTRDISATAKSLNESSKTVSATAERSLEVLTREISATAKSLRKAADALATTAERFENPSKLISGPSSSELGPGEKKVE